jgi:hypothetical protein
LNREELMRDIRRLVVQVILTLGLLTTSCQRQTPPATDSRSLKEHADALKKQHQREMQNK